MKNVVPVIVAVLLALGAVFAVSRYFRQASSRDTEMIDIVVAATDLKESTIIREDDVRSYSIPVNMFPKQAFKWSEVGRLINQTVSRKIAKDDFILTRDIANSDEISKTVGEGEWAVSVNFDNSDIVHYLHPGDEIAIFANISVIEQKESVNMNEQKAEAKKHNGTVVLLPRARVMDASIGNANQGRESIIMLSLPPQQANMIVAAQQRGLKLYPALRRKNDKQALNRLDAGVVDDMSFQDLLRNMKGVRLPEVPSPEKSN